MSDTSAEALLMCGFAPLPWKPLFHPCLLNLSRIRRQSRKRKAQRKPTSHRSPVPSTELRVDSSSQRSTSTVCP